MKRLVSLLLCLSLGIFTVARAMKPSQTLAAIAKIDQKDPTGQKADAKALLDDASKAPAQAEEQEVTAEENTDEEVASDDNGMEDASDDEGEDMSDDGASDDDTGGDDDSGDDGGDYGGE